ncbi:thiazole/oxazole-forming peptide maturase SagD family component [Salinibacterium sp. CAN_S4]|uniref:YcaO-like family protein n=1 Tax=Salinibacterium sp. CAN_S4 TaxID=2787727 RepID=UPI0018F0508E
MDAGTTTAIELLEPGILSGIAHYCGADLREGVRKSASAVEIVQGGERWFDLRDWEPHDPALHNIPGFPFSLFEPQRTREWVLGRDQDGEVWVPLSLVHAGYLREGDDASSATNANNLVGLQAGRSWEDAVERACAHIVAHDAMAVWWSSTATAQEAPLPELVQQVFESSPLQVTVLAIQSTTGLPVRLAVVDDRVDEIVSLGFAAHAIADQASELAVVEALIQHASARDLATEKSLIRNSAALGNGAIAGLAPFDPTRQYAHAFENNHRGLIDPMAHIQYGIDPKVVARTRARVTASGLAASVQSSSAFVTTLQEAGRVVILDVTTERVRSAGLHAARVLMPGFARMQPAAFPLDPTGRLSRAREVLDWQSDAHPTPYPGW